VNRWLIPLLGLVAVACSAARNDNSPQAQCERQAENDPKVVEVYTRGNGGYTYADNPERNALLLAKREAMMRCMRSMGLLPAGGVQPVQPQ
jgi:hypothetical protein